MLLGGRLTTDGRVPSAVWVRGSGRSAEQQVGDIVGARYGRRYVAMREAEADRVTMGR